MRIKGEGKCGRAYHLALKCSGLDSYTEINVLRYMCGDCVIYIQNVDGILKEMLKSMDKNKKYLREKNIVYVENLNRVAENIKEKIKNKICIEFENNKSENKKMRELKLTEN